MSEMATTTTHWHETAEAGLPGAPEWLLRVRAEALERFEALGWPARGDTRYAYTDLKPIQAGAPAATPGAATEDDLAPFLSGDESALLVFIDGRLDASLSRTDDLPDGVVVRAASTDLAGLDREHLERLAATDDPLVALDVATFQDGAVVRVPRGTTVAGTLHLMFVTTGPGLRVLHNHIHVGEDAEAMVLESHVHLADNEGLTLSHTTLAAAPAARLRHVKVQKEDRRARHVATQEVVQERDADVHSTLLDVGATQARQAVTATLRGRGASCELGGVFFGQRDQRRDVWTRIDHEVPDCTSTETFKGILDDASRGAFTGLVVVHPGAHGTNSDQQNRNLLLSTKAHADATPQLEIHNDDVKCAHGSTIGQLDEEALFFLRSRGIGAQQARLMLTRAFASDVIQGVPSAPIRTLLDRYLHVWFIKHQEHL